MSKEKRLTNTDSKFYTLNPSKINFLERKLSSANIITLIKDDYFG